MVDPQILEILQSDQQLDQIVFDFLEVEGVKEGLREGTVTMKGLNLKYSITMWVISSWTNRLTNLGKLLLPFTIYR